MAEATVKPAPSTAPTLRQAVASATAALARAGVEGARLDAEILLASAIGATRNALYLSPEARLDPDAAPRFGAMIARRVEREPVAYILGRKPFRRLDIEVDSRVLIPRPETELLVEVGCSLPPGARAADVGTGSGAVALALKDERPDLEVWGLELSAAALEVARANAARMGLEVRFANLDLLGGESEGTGPVTGGWDAVLANLPYVEQGAELAPEISRHEPPEALFAGVDGLDLLRRLVIEVAHAERVALVALEVGAGQAPAVSDLLLAAGFPSVQRLRDLAGHERVVVGRR